ADLPDLVGKLPSPKVIWIMLPAGKPVAETLEALGALLGPGDLVVDGGNTHYRDDVTRAEKLQSRGVRFMDAGVSGGVWGLQEGYCLMLGGASADFQALEPLLKTLAPADGYLHCGPVGAGHFVKMIHNGVEYALMEAYGEGFELLQASPYGGELALQKVAALWNRGSVVRSWILELLEAALARNHDLAGVSGHVEDSGEGRWTVEQAVADGVDATNIAQALFKRFRSRRAETFSDKVVAALRNEFGGHGVHGANPK
ncbi:MAG: decarboxylating 6-phosphogluconate dehydrogenase, partial [Candidatus Firestonebacteria bacterium]|nr:decarboxylating 6-phosphogluconate dehydrogenase [Candidatus Firestonebacteria bacterium]